MEKIAIKASWPTPAAAQPPMAMIIRLNVAHHPREPVVAGNPSSVGTTVTLTVHYLLLNLALETASAPTAASVFLVGMASALDRGG